MLKKCECGYCPEDCVMEVEGQEFWAIVNKRTGQIVEEDGQYGLYLVIYIHQGVCEEHKKAHYGSDNLVEVKKVTVETKC